MMTNHEDSTPSCSQAESRFRGLAENMPDVAIILDGAGIVRFVNRAPSPASREEVLGRRCSEYVAPEHVPTFLGMLQRALNTRAVQIGPVADRWGRWWETRFVPLVEADSSDAVLVIATDMTERQRAVDLLRESDERFRWIADNVSDLIWTIEFDEPLCLPDGLTPDAAGRLAAEVLDRGRFTYASPSVERVLGYATGEFLAMRLREVLTPESLALTVRFLGEELAAETIPGRDPRRSRVVETDQIARDGRICICEVKGAFLRNAQGRPIGLVGVTRDITQRRRAEQSLRESEAMLRGLVQNMPDLVVVVDRNAVIQYVNHGVGSVSPSEMLGRTGFGFMTPEDQGVCRRSLQDALETGRVQEVEVVDVFDLCWSCRVVPIPEEGEAVRAMVICSDVTERKRAEAEVRKEQDLLRHLLELSERDRQLVAFEIHDGVAQQLTGAMMNFEACGRLAATFPSESQRPLQEGLRLLRESIEETRRLVTGLRPPALDAFGILPAIEHLIQENMAAGGPEIEFITAPRFDRLARPLENAIFRILQESLTNARRHSRTQRIRVELGKAKGKIRLTVRDWGVGFDPAQVSADRFGLKGIRERARLLGGSALIDTAPGKGTRITVDLPLILDTSAKA